MDTTTQTVNDAELKTCLEKKRGRGMIFKRRSKRSARGRGELQKESAHDQDDDRKGD
jgi:hypothetical protein